MKMRTAILFALLAAALYALNAPLSKLLLSDVAPSMMAALLYLGAGLGMLVLGLLRRSSPSIVIKLQNKLRQNL